MATRREATFELRTALTEGDYGIAGPTTYVFPPIQRVIFGMNALDQLSAECQRLGADRCLVVSTASLAGSQLLDYVRRSLGDRIAGIFTASKQHVPVESLDALISLARQLRPNGLISLGGGSAIDSAKALAGALAVGAKTGEQLLDFKIVYEYPDKVEQKPYEGSFIPHIALSTTLSAAEYDGIFGYTHQGTKFLSAGDALVPTSIFLDPQLTLETPGWLLASTGIRAVDHCIETYLAKSPTPPTDAACIHALKMLVANLPTAAKATDPTPRLQCQLAGWLSMSGVSNVTLGLSHGIGHQLGARANVPHGVTSCVMLPVVLDHLFANSPERHVRLAAIADAMTGTTGLGAEYASAALRQLVELLALPTRLRDVGVKRASFSEIAEASMGDLVVGFSPVRVSKADIVALLEAAY